MSWAITKWTGCTHVHPIYWVATLAAAHTINHIEEESTPLKVVAIADGRVGIAQNFTAINHWGLFIEDVANSSSNGPGVGVIKQRCAVQEVIVGLRIIPT